MTLPPVRYVLYVRCRVQGGGLSGLADGRPVVVWSEFGPLPLHVAGIRSSVKEAEPHGQRVCTPDTGQKEIAICPKLHLPLQSNLLERLGVNVRKLGVDRFCNPEYTPSHTTSLASLRCASVHGEQSRLTEEDASERHVMMANRAVLTIQRRTLYNRF